MVDEECGQLQDHASSSLGSPANFLRNQIRIGVDSIDLVIYIKNQLLIEVNSLAMDASNYRCF